MLVCKKAREIINLRFEPGIQNKRDNSGKKPQSLQTKVRPDITNTLKPRERLGRIWWETVLKEEFAIWGGCGIRAAIFYSEYTKVAKTYTERI